MIKKRVLIIGASGMLGQRLAKHYAANTAYEVLGASADETIRFPEVTYCTVDLAHREEVKKLIFDFVPDVIINAAAFTNVDRAETERESAWKINVKGVEHIAEAARVLDAHVIQFSTDYVFDGKNGPYAETDTPCPIGYYGRTKLAGENTLRISGTLHTIIRTNVLYGIIPNGRPDFVRWVVEELKQKRHIRIVTDQINNPTFIDDLVTAVATVERYKKYGLFNIGGMEMLSRFDFTMRIIDAFDLDRRYVEAISTEQLQQAARRPLKSGLIILKAQTELDYKPSPLDESLLRMKQEIAL